MIVENVCNYTDKFFSCHNLVHSIKQYNVRQFFIRSNNKKFEIFVAFFPKIGFLSPLYCCRISTLSDIFFTSVVCFVLFIVCFPTRTLCNLCLGSPARLAPSSSSAASSATTAVRQYEMLNSSFKTNPTFCAAIFVLYEFFLRGRICECLRSPGIDSWDPGGPARIPCLYLTTLARMDDINFDH